MWALIGMLAGALAGQALWHEWGAVVGGLAGFLLGAALSSNRQRNAYRKPDAPMAAPLPRLAPGPDTALADRIAQLERRIATLEREIGRAPAEVPILAPAEVPILPPAEKPIAAPAPAPLQTEDTAGETISVAPATTPAPNPLWAWFTGGNALTRIGVVVLFIGVAFLLRYFAEHFALTLEMKLSGVAAAGVALIALGWRLAPARPGYGLSLQGAGAGILYITTYATGQLYAVMPPDTAMFVLVGVAALTVGLALRADSQPLAALAIAGGFLAPILVERHGEPALLFGYFAVLNGAILVLALRRTWRALNVLGFVFTFALGLVWGARYYVPAHFATVEPFLILFVVFYVAIALLEARASALDVRHPLTGLLVFGAPLAGFALQAALVRDIRFGAAWSAVALALAYAGLHLALRRRVEPGLALLGRAFLALAVIFATLAIPFTFEDQWTAGLWAVEAAGVYWMGVQQRSTLARAFALLVELGAGAAFVWSGVAWGADPLFGNAHFIAAMLIALSGLATAWFADHADDALSPAERPLTPLAFTWGMGWLLGAGGMELAAHLSQPEATHAILAWVTVWVAVALALRRPLAWPRLAWAGSVLLPAMAWVALRDFDSARTTQQAYGYVVFPLAWIVQWCVLHAAETLRASPSQPAHGTSLRLRSVGPFHVMSVLALTAQVAWEAGEWVGRATPAHTAWVACATALPAILCLGIVTRWRNASFWPFRDYGEAYAAGAGSSVAALLAVWFVAANALSPGDAAPLPWFPLVNPLDLTLALALAAMLAWARRFASLSVRARYVWIGVALFILLNGIVLRTAHHWADIPWRMSALLASKPVSAALTLTWTATALVLMFTATRHRLRPLWMTGAALLAIVVGKLFLIDLGALSGLPRVVSFLGVGVLLLVVGYLSPLPPAARDDADTPAEC